MSKSRGKRVWWTLKFLNGEIDIDDCDCLHLYRTKEAAVDESYEFAGCDEAVEAGGGLPTPVKVRLVVEGE